MINFRYHVVTLVAVFLALGLGVLFGASFIDQQTVSSLQRSQQSLGHRNSELRREVIALQKEQQSLQAFAAASRDLLIRGSLAGRPVVVLTFESTDNRLIADVEDTLIKSGSSFSGSFRISEDLDLRTEEGKRRVASALQIPTDGDVVETLTQQLSDSLSGRQPGYLQKLIDAGLASVSQPSGSEARPPGEVADAGTSVIILPPGPRDTTQRPLLLPLVRSLAAGSVPTVAAQAVSEAAGLVGAIRDEEDLKVVTVDQANQPMGQAAIALGLQAALSGTFGHYGIGEGATAPLPAPQTLVS